jgi:hypothetical protein
MDRKDEAGARDEAKDEVKDAVMAEEVGGDNRAGVNSNRAEVKEDQ